MNSQLTLVRVILFVSSLALFAVIVIYMAGLGKIPPLNIVGILFGIMLIMQSFLNDIKGYIHFRRVTINRSEKPFRFLVENTVQKILGVLFVLAGIIFSFIQLPF